MTGMTAARVAGTIGAVALAGGALAAAGRFAPVNGQWQNGPPAGGPIDKDDAIFTGVMAVLGAGAGLVGAMAGGLKVGAPFSAGLALSGAALGAVLLGSAVVGIGLRE